MCCFYSWFIPELIFKVILKSKFSSEKPWAGLTLYFKYASEKLMHFFNNMDCCDILRSSAWQIDQQAFESLGVSLHALPHEHGINLEILLTTLEILDKFDSRENVQIDAPSTVWPETTGKQCRKINSFFTSVWNVYSYKMSFLCIMQWEICLISV